MKILFSLLLSVCIPFLLISQKMIEQDKVWSYVELCGPISPPPIIPCDEVVVYSMGTPELLDTEYYYRLRYSNIGFLDYNDPDWKLSDLFFREDSVGRVYVRDSFSMEELIYDFSLNVNDVFFNERANCEMTLMVKDSIELYNGEKAENFIFEDGTQWIKGIGSVHALLSDCSNSSNNWLVVCVKKGEEFLLHEDTECFFLFVDNNDISKQDINSFPNPFSTWLVLNLGNNLKATSIQIYNSSGQLELNIGITHTEQQIIDMHQLADGIYFLQAGDYVEKIVKQSN